jgi:hypothetical protein
MDERPVFSPTLASIIEAMLAGKFENPILGLYGAALLLAAREYDEGENAAARQVKERRPRTMKLARDDYGWALEPRLFEAVIANLRKLLGTNHPDVEALSLCSIDPNLHPGGPFRIPPMLRRSWSILVRASNRKPDLLPIETWTPIAAMVPVGPFLAWRPSGARTSPVARPIGGWSAFRMPVQRLVSFLVGPAATAITEIGDAAVAALRSAIPEDARPRDLLPEEEPGAVSARLARLAIELDVPRAAIERAVQRDTPAVQVPQPSGRS